MSGIIAVYGLVIAVLIAQAVGPTTNMSLYTYVSLVGRCGAWHKLTLHRGFMHLAAGMSVGLTGVAAGYTIGVVGDAVSTLYTQQRERTIEALTATLGCPSIYATVSGLRGNDSHPDLWRSSRTLRVRSKSDYLDYSLLTWSA